MKHALPFTCIPGRSFFGALALATAVLLFIFRNTDNDDDDEEVGWLRKSVRNNGSDLFFALGIIAAFVTLLLWMIYR